MVSGLDVVFYTVVFLVPGFVSYSVITKLVPLSRKDEKTALLIYLSLTGINYVAWWRPLSQSLRNQWFEIYPFLTVLFWFAAVIISPAVLGLVLGAANQKRYLDRLLSRLRLDCVDPVPTAWDWVFSQKGQEWVAVTLKSGKIFYGVHKFASSDPSERDVFLDQVWQVDDDGRWQPVEDSTGVLIAADEIMSIEFRSADAQEEAL